MQLEIFKAVAEQGSISAAAQLIHRVPSNLTTRIKQLEQDLGVELFIREKSRLRLSPAGWNFLGYARRILDLVQEARATVAGEEPQGAFALGSLESTATVRSTCATSEPCAPSSKCSRPRRLTARRPQDKY